jgi:hypothetical protein
MSDDTYHRLATEIRDSREETRRELAQINANISLIRSALEGALGSEGLIAQVSTLRARVELLEAARWRQQGIALLAGMVASGVVTLGLRALLS